MIVVTCLNTTNKSEIFSYLVAPIDWSFLFIHIFVPFFDNFSEGE